MILENIVSYSLSLFDIETFKVESQVLKNNPLGDSPVKYNLVLKPKSYKSSDKYNLVVVLAGFTGNSSKYFNYKSFERNFPQSIDRWYLENKQEANTLFLFVEILKYKDSKI